MSMLNANVRLSDLTPVAALFNPISQGVATVTTSWVDASVASTFMALVVAGVMGASGTIDAKLQQATDGAGTGAKDVTGKAITQLVKATDDNKFSIINLRPEELDIALSFCFFRLSITVGTAASLLFAAILAGEIRFAPLTALAAQKQVVS